MAGHARYSPSAAYRRLKCPPSLVLEEQFADEESAYAAEGTAGHALAEHLLKKYLHQRTKRPTSDYYTDELVGAVEEYVSFVTAEIEEARQECANPVICIEQRVDASDYVDGCFGTADAVIVTDTVAHVIDLKLGKGVPVFAEENPQLMIYGLGVLGMADLLYDVSIVRLSVFQPRLSSSSTWDISPMELREWGENTLKPRGAMALMGTGEFAAGAWCRFCRAKNTCRARAEEFLALTKLEFRAPALLSDDEIAEVLKKSDELAKWASDVYAFAQDQAILHDKVWPGFKLVEGRSNRKYTSEADVADAAEAAGYADIYKKTLIGVTEMERLMGKSEFSRILGAFVVKPQGKITLAPDSDRRDPITKSIAMADFEEERI